MSRFSLDLREMRNHSTSMGAAQSSLPRPDLRADRQMFAVVADHQIGVGRDALARRGSL